ncbi:HET-domain-containing protein, partial [Hyaloscypha hepaticicola]
MRLLHTRTLELSEFLENATPAYAILSHTWEKEEVSFKDMQGPNAKKKAGYAKIQKCCEQAARDGYEYVWIDTCCIDKSSSAELSEAINSMYVWYKNAKTCYAYLADLDTKGWFGWLSEAPESFKKSRWFTRGWTLQELIAPARLEFFDKYWSPFGTKADRHSVLSEITGIDELTLIGGRELREVSIAKRMSWASKRVTTRVEDIAYCLIGIFGVNLPLLYGEGERAFIRLQEEIMRSSDDQSLFAWGFTDQESKKKPEPQRSTLRGFLARSPAAFEKSGNVVPYRNWDVSMPYSMTNQGLRLELPVVQHEGFK